MKTLTFILPALLVGCGFTSRPLDVGHPTFDADEIAALSDAGRHQQPPAAGSTGRRDAAADVDAADMAAADVDAADVAGSGGSAETQGADAGAAASGDSGPDAETEPQAGSAAPEPDAGPPEMPRPICFECQTNAGCDDSALCYAGFCQPKMTSSCANVCGGALPKMATAYWLGLGVQICTADDGASKLSQSCLNFFAAGHSCD